MVSVEMRVAELPQFALLGRVVFEGTLLKMGHLVETVHVELPDKGGETIVLEEAWKDIVTESDMVGDKEGCTVGRPTDELIGVGIVDHAA